MVERVSEEMHIAALVSGLRKNLAQRRSEAGVIVGDDKFDTMETARFDPTWTAGRDFAIENGRNAGG